MLDRAHQSPQTARAQSTPPGQMMMLRLIKKATTCDDTRTPRPRSKLRKKDSRDHAAPAAAAGPLLVHVVVLRHFAAEHGLGHPLVVAQLVAELLDLLLF